MRLPRYIPPPNVDDAIGIVLLFALLFTFLHIN